MSIYICGDSTAASYTPAEAPMMGWGQALAQYLPEERIENRAKAGRSTKSFLAEGRLQQIETEIQPGDLLLIQFTHNDRSDLVWRHTDPWSSFRNNLAIFVDTARQNRAVPVLMTPICQRCWLNGELQETHGDYAWVIELLAAERNVPLIDLYQESLALLRRIGENESRKLYMHVEPGEYPACPDGKQDDTHTRRAGAEAYARIVAETLRKLGLAGR